MNILFASTSENPDEWLPFLERALPGDRFFVVPQAAIDVALVGTPPAGLFARLPRLRFVQSLWMGVESLLADPGFPRAVPLARLVDPGMVAAMSETVLAHVLDWHRHHYRYRALQQESRWRALPQYLASDRTIGVLGLGELGGDAAHRLRALGFNVAGWSRRPREMAGVACHTDLDAMLPACDALVCLLPLTRHTQGILDARSLRRMKSGGCVVNVGRGGHVVLPDLLAELDSGRLAHAYLDVFDREPLPQDDPLWRHPAVTVTPHVAALADVRTALPRVVDNIERVRRGEPPLNLVDFGAGY